ncbi:MAG: DUF1549 domain-containing protein, partial [Pirellulaceae bacterium]|nr:DUF1549 domain-containing protein [Pirellulaceae bacterium]
MRSIRFQFFRFALLALVLGTLSISGPRQSMHADDLPEFSRDILPILSENCFACHGPDENVREAGLRLDKQDSAYGELESGLTAVVPGQSGQSELLHRILSDDSDLKMPPEDSGKKLTVKQQEMIKSWIDGGAKWDRHWAFVPPVSPQIPAEIMDWSGRNTLDRFVFDRLKKEGLSPEAAADRQTLIRRVTLDLTGLPPTVKEIDAYLADQNEGAYERVVDRLLSSKTYGEHMGRVWLDSARYADTHGLHLDNERQIWPYRNWVIKAINQNMPFDQFTIEQLAGDLMPTPKLDQRVATGFNR